MTIMVMPMAGNGSRMSKNVNVPKPLIDIHEHPMFYWAAKNFNVDKMIFIVRRDHVINNNINKVIKSYFPKSVILIQEEKLSGQLLSTLIAKEHLETEEDVFIVDCDMYSDVNLEKFIGLNSEASILTFYSNSPNYSYISKKNNLVDTIVEKNVISDEAIGGIFYWKRGHDFLKHAKQCIENNVKTNNEYYISGVYSEGIKNGCRVKTITSDKVYDLSTKDGIKNFTSYQKIINKI
jgi:NDP-sugar pyrophosphorylase family protein